jgi:hypothetical protein
MASTSRTAKPPRRVRTRKIAATVAQPRLEEPWFDECLSAFKPKADTSYYPADDGEALDGIMVTIESGELDAPKSLATRLTELEAIAEGDLKTRLRDLGKEFERFPGGVYMWMWWSDLYPGATSRYMPAFDEQAREDEFRRIRALSIQAASSSRNCKHKRIPKSQLNRALQPQGP